MKANDLSIYTDERIRPLLDAMPVGITIANPALQVQYQSPVFRKWLPDFPSEPALALKKLINLANSIEFRLPKELSILRERVLIQGSDYEFLITFQRNYRWQQYQITIKPIFDKTAQNVIGIIETVENMTELYESNQALLQAKRYENVGRLASGIAHDFNNILQVIIGHCEILAPVTQKIERANRSVDIILTSSQKAASLTRQILMFSRKQECEFKIFEPLQLLTGLEKILSRMVGEDIKIDLCCKNKWGVNADESQIEQIFLNLTVNSRDAMPEGGKIVIEVSDCMLSDRDCTELNLVKPGKYVKFRFSDTGHGISNENLEHIFDPFFSTKDKCKSFGLGLSTVYSVVRQHQGIITVQSVPDQGTVFEFYLPAIEHISPLPQEVLADVTPLKPLTESILVVEDDQMVCDLASQVLSMHGYRVETAETMMDAIAKVLKSRYDLYLIDIVLPDGSGVDLMEYIKDIDPDAAFILSSGYTDDKPQIKKVIESGYEFLHKPYAINTLLNTCRMILDRR